MSEITSVETTSVETITAAQVELQQAEQLLRLKYPTLNIIPGSLVQEENHPVYSNKRRVRLICDCGVTVERATSDLWTFKGCVSCLKAVRKAEKAKKKVETLEALAALKATQES